MTAGDEKNQQSRGEDHLNVQVRYSSATQPFVEPNADRSELLESFRARVMLKFEVTDQKLPDGGQKIFYLYHENTRLENLHLTLGQVAGNEKQLKLKLVETVIQG